MPSFDATPDPLDAYSSVLPGGTAEAWARLAPVVPEWMYLVGGTALAIHLRHRVSRDLDLFSERPFDAAEHADSLIAGFPDFTPTKVADGTINGILGRTKIQFLDASSQHRLVDTSDVAGICVAGVEDILATKLKVIMDRGELRDYFDLMHIETDTELDVVEGISLYLDRYRPVARDQHVYHIIRSLGYFEDIEGDPELPVDRHEIESYWKARQTAIAKILALG